MITYSREFTTIVDEIKKIDKVILKRIYKPNENLECAIFNRGRNVIELFHSDGFVNINTSIKDNTLTPLMISIINEVLKSRPCLYYKERVEKSLTFLHCYEWDNYDMDAHVTRFIKASKDKDLERVSNIQVLTGKPLSYYEERIDKRPGIYPGNLSKEDEDFSNYCSEFNLYYLIGEKVLELSKLTKGNVDKPLNEYNSLEEETRFAIEYLCARTKTFGVDIKIPDDYTALDLSNGYDVWNDSWNRYLVTLDGEVLSRLNEMAKQRIDVYPMLQTVNSNMNEEGIKHILVLDKYLNR